ncbi:MAG: LysM peptidoglycan-binding domain-containing protein [Bacteroidales bacterium]|nr:LysM peptidoglycan-binding domain-containing protein [Bacteroidales bacterium]
MSLGGYGTIDLAATYPHRIAAAMAICGGGTARDFCGLNELPLWILHGTADRAVPIAQSKKVMSAMEQCGSTDRLIFTPLEGYNHTQPAKILYMSETYDWLFQHRLDDPYRTANRSYDISTANIPHAYNSIDRTNAKKVRVASRPAATASGSVAESRQTEPSGTGTATPQYYTVKKGDTLSAIAKRHHTTVAKLCSLNKIKATTTLQIGRRLRVR